MENNLIDPDCGLYLTVGSLIEINNIITSSNNIILRKVNVKTYGFDKMFKDKELIDQLYLYKLDQIIHQFTERKITYTKFYSILLNKINPFYDRNGRTCLLMMLMILFANDDIIRQNI